MLPPIFRKKRGHYMNLLKLISAIPPSVNHYLAYRTVSIGGKPMSISYKTKDAVKYRTEFAQYVSEEVIKQKWALEPNNTQHFYVDAVFYFPRIDMDANNYWKVMLDAITDTKLIWLDDNVVCERVQGIFYDTKSPRVEIQIKPVDYIGVFQNASQLEDFTSRCIGCTRYKRNCSLLGNALSGKVQEEVTGCECSKYKGINK